MKEGHIASNNDQMGNLVGNARFVGSGIAAGVLFVLMGYLLPSGSSLATIIFDHRPDAPLPYPFSIQTVEWILFFAGLGEIAHCYARGNVERSQLRAGLLPEDDEYMLTAEDIEDHARDITSDPTAKIRILPKLLLRSIWQFKSTGSIEQATDILKATLDLCQHEIDLRYTFLRYLVWVIPTIGFIGTVWGISQALLQLAPVFNQAADVENITAVFPVVLGSLGTAFNTTLIALVQSVVLVLLMNSMLAREEKVLNDSGQYAIDHLINKIYLPN